MAHRSGTNMDVEEAHMDRMQRFSCPIARVEKVAWPSGAPTIFRELSMTAGRRSTVVIATCTVVRTFYSQRHCSYSIDSFSA